MRRQQNNKYAVKFDDGTEHIIKASCLGEAKRLLHKIEGVQSVQRVFKNSKRIIQNTKGKVHYV